MFESLEHIESQLREMEQQLADPVLLADMDAWRKVNREYVERKPIAKAYQEYTKALNTAKEDREMLKEAQDADMEAMLKADLDEQEDIAQKKEEELKLLLVPKDPNDYKNVIVEIRAGAGGDEAGLFAGDLYRMYHMYAEKEGYTTEELDRTEQGIGGIKEATFMVKGEGAYSRLKYESGVHRVQRVPETESSGRIHTSTATVAVLPEAEDVDVQLNLNDVRIDVYRSSGHGGQCVNTTDSAVRVTHFPSGIVVTCQNERSQIQNKAACMQILKARLYEIELEKRAEALDEIRGPKTTIGFGNQIRSYVLYPYQMVKDLRTGVETSNVEAVLDDGDLDPFVIGYHRWATGNADAEAPSA